jgi:hypothetical protein
MESVNETTVRSAMHSADEFEAFTKLHDEEPPRISRRTPQPILVLDAMTFRIQ